MPITSNRPNRPHGPRWLNIDEWKTECLLSEQNCKFLQKRINELEERCLVLTKEKEEYKIRARELENAILIHIGNKV